MKRRALRARKSNRRVHNRRAQTHQQNRSATGREGAAQEKGKKIKINNNNKRRRICRRAACTPLHHTTATGGTRERHRSSHRRPARAEAPAELECCWRGSVHKRRAEERVWRGARLRHGEARRASQCAMRPASQTRRRPPDRRSTYADDGFVSCFRGHAGAKEKQAGRQPANDALPQLPSPFRFLWPPRVRFAGVPPLTAPALQAAIQTHLAFFDSVVGLLHIPSHRLQRSQQSKYNKMNLLHSLRNGPKQPIERIKRDCVSGTSQARIANPVSDILCTGPI